MSDYLLSYIIILHLVAGVLLLYSLYYYAIGKSQEKELQSLRGGPYRKYSRSRNLDNGVKAYMCSTDFAFELTDVYNSKVPVYNSVDACFDKKCAEDCGISEVVIYKVKDVLTGKLS